MRIATWNLNGGASVDKVEACRSRLAPDVLILPECPDPGGLAAVEGAPQPTSSAFIGPASQKGLAAVAYGDYRLELVDAIYDPDLIRIAPLAVQGSQALKILAVWPDNSDRHRRPLLDALDVYADWLSTGDVIIAGDFNDGPEWAEPNSSWTTTEARLTDLGLTNATAGRSPSFFMHRHQDRPYHLDHIFVPSAWTVDRAEVGAYAEWTTMSDHLPVSATLTPA